MYNYKIYNNVAGILTAIGSIAIIITSIASGSLIAFILTLAFGGIGIWLNYITYKGIAICMEKIEILEHSWSYPAKTSYNNALINNRPSNAKSSLFNAVNTPYEWKCRACGRKVQNSENCMCGQTKEEN